jgi:hypothetical protein
MTAEPPFRVEIDESRAPTFFVVTVDEPECMTLHWQFYDRWDAERKARAERKRLTELFAVAA